MHLLHCHLLYASEMSKTSFLDTSGLYVCIECCHFQYTTSHLVFSSHPRCEERDLFFRGCCYRTNLILSSTSYRSLFGFMGDHVSKKHSVSFSQLLINQICLNDCWLTVFYVRVCVCLHTMCARWIIKAPNGSFITKKLGRPSCLGVLQRGSDGDFNLSSSASPKTLHSSYWGACQHRL